MGLLTDSKLWTQIVRRGAPSAEQASDIRSEGRLGDDIKKRIVRQMATALNERVASSTDGREVVHVNANGTTIEAGLLLRSFVGYERDCQLTPVRSNGATITFQIRAPENGMYQNPANGFEKVLGTLGFHHATALGNSEERIGDHEYAKPKELAHYSNATLLKELKYIEINVDAKSLLKEIGMEDVNLAADSHASRMEHVAKAGVDYTKYLEKRGEQAGVNTRT